MTGGWEGEEEGGKHSEDLRSNSHRKEGGEGGSKVGQRYHGVTSQPRPHTTKAQRKRNGFTTSHIPHPSSHSSHNYTYIYAYLFTSIQHDTRTHLNSFSFIPSRGLTWRGRQSSNQSIKIKYLRGWVNSLINPRKLPLFLFLFT